MKIAYISPYDLSYPGGVNEHITGLAFAAQQQGHQVGLIGIDSGYQAHTFPDTCVVSRKIVKFTIGGATARVGLAPFVAARLKKILSHHHFDVVHLHEPLVPGLTWQLLQQQAVLSETAVVGTFHAYHEQKSRLYAWGRPFLTRLFNRLDSLIAVSPLARDFIGQFFPGNYHIIPNGVSLARFAPQHQAEIREKAESANRPLTILFVGRLDERKGFAHLLDSYARLKPKLPQLRLQVVGPFGPAEAKPYQQRARQLGLNDIDFVGYVPPAKLPAIYHSADIFCAPSIGGESFGIVLLEAMAAGLPVVASDIAGYRAVLTSGREGVLVAPGQPALLADAIRQLAGAPHLRQQLAKHARRKAAHYSWDRIIAKTLTVYHNTIKQNQKRIYQVSPLKNLGNT